MSRRTAHERRRLRPVGLRRLSDRRAAPVSMGGKSGPRRRRTRIRRWQPRRNQRLPGRRANDSFLCALPRLLEGRAPVGTAAYVAGINFPLLAAISLAPVAGHAFSPFLRWRGGKAVAVTFGIWAGLTAWEGPIILGVGLLVGTKLFGANGWAVLAALLLLAVYLAAVPASLLAWSLRPASNWLLMTLAGNLLLLIWKHRQDLMHLPTF